MDKCKHKNCCRKATKERYCYTHYLQYKKHGETKDIISRRNEYFKTVGIEVAYKEDNLIAVIDEEDLEKVIKYKWRYNGRYVTTYKYLLHRLIMNAKQGEVVDHINGNTLDNRKSNLRICSVKENTRNHKRYSTNTSGHGGVYKNRNRWRARIKVDNKLINLGSYENIEDAVKARKEAEKKYFGEFRRSDDLSIR